jgi:cystathionine gamma-synthase
MEIEEARGILGGVSSPHDAYLLLRGLKTLDVRVCRQNENALRIAQFLEGHPVVRRVYYPGLPSHPEYEIAKQQMTGFGGVVSFEIEGDLEQTSRFIDRLRLPYIGPTLGGVESVVQQPATLYSIDPEEWQAGGIKDNLVRYAVGIEDAEDLMTDLSQALAGLQPTTRRVQ